VSGLFAGPYSRRGARRDRSTAAVSIAIVLRNVRRTLARKLHRRGIYRIGAEPFCAIDKDRLFRRYGILCSTLAPTWASTRHIFGIPDTEGALFRRSPRVAHSSFLATTDRFHDEHPGVVVTSRETVQIRRLDGFVYRVPEGARTWIKLEVEGYEPQAIAGGRQLISRADALEVELATERALRRGAALLLKSYRPTSSGSSSLPSPRRSSPLPVGR
jgi:hypothetical protein